MRKLTVLRSSPVIQSLMQRLGDASIDATCTTEYDSLESDTGGELPVSVWITNSRDWPRAFQILNDVWADCSSERCPSCDYDLQGHRGKAVCPECGKAVRTPVSQVKCTHCGESVPETFEVCWSCGADVLPSVDRDA